MLNLSVFIGLYLWQFPSLRPGLRGALGIRFNHIRKPFKFRNPSLQQVSVVRTISRLSNKDRTDGAQDSRGR